MKNEWYIEVTVQVSNRESVEILLGLEVNGLHFFNISEKGISI